MPENGSARPQRARIIEEYKNLQDIASLPLPSLLPDLNPIEHLWDEPGRRVRNRDPAVSTLREVCKALLEEWGRLPRIKRMKLVTSIIKRCQIVIQQKDGYTQFKPEVADYCEPFRELCHQMLKVYAP